MARVLDRGVRQGCHVSALLFIVEIIIFIFVVVVGEWLQLLCDSYSVKNVRIPKYLHKSLFTIFSPLYVCTLYNWQRKFLMAIKVLVFLYYYLFIIIIIIIIMACCTKSHSQSRHFVLASRPNHSLQVMCVCLFRSKLNEYIYLINNITIV